MTRIVVRGGSKYFVMQLYYSFEGMYLFCAVVVLVCIRILLVSHKNVLFWYFFVTFCAVLGVGGIDVFGARLM